MTESMKNVQKLKTFGQNVNQGSDEKPCKG